jgi:hypothetical protein
MILLALAGLAIVISSWAFAFDYVIDDLNFYPIPAVSKPAKGEIYTDPIFHSQIVRITDSVLDNCEGKKWFYSGYPKHSCENADGTIITVQGSYDSGWCFWQAVPPYKKLGCIPTKWVEWKRRLDVRWDYQDPHVCYFTMSYGTKAFYKYILEFKEDGTLKDGQMTMLHNFQEDIDAHWSEWNVQSVEFWEEGDSSDNSRYWVWSIVAYDEARTLGTRWPRPGILVYDKDHYGKDNGKTIATLRWDQPGWRHPGFCSMSPSGKYVWTGDAHRLYDRNLNMLRDMNLEWGHADMAISAEGREVIFGYSIKDGKYWYAMEDLETGELTYLVEKPNAGYHASGNCHLTPGWGVYSCYHPRWPEVPFQWGQHEIDLVELTTRTDPPPKVWRVCHTHTLGQRTDGVDDPFGKITRDGKRLYFSSGWGCSYGNDEGCEIDIFQITLPETWREDIAAGEYPVPPPYVAPEEQEKKYSVTFEWDASTDPDDNLAGYRLYQSLESGGYTKGEPIAQILVEELADPNKPQYILPDVSAGGPYYWNITAYDADGLESDFNDEVSSLVPIVEPQPISNPKNLRIKEIK